MKIEITRKQLILAAITIAVLALSLNGGYFVGLYQDKNHKSDGSHFYSESFDENMNGTSYRQCEIVLYRSTIECSNIRFGTARDQYGHYKTWEKTKIPCIFYSKCMDNELISICERIILSAYPDDVMSY